MVLYDSTDIATSAKKFSAGYQQLSTEGLPPALYVQQVVMVSPHGKMFGVVFLWGSDDHETGQVWLAKIAALGDVVMNSVAPNTIDGFLKFLKTIVPPNVYGAVKTISIPALTPEEVAIMARNFEKMPATDGAAFCMHEL